ncbi:MAG: cytochrome c biogenesis protein [Candidatus Thalassarchaeaceae archaeon]|nr:cytochrome c biogenesis protein [Candidatus Thalassarchaeaceae archaeon]
MVSMKHYGWVLTCIGGAGVLLTAVLGYTYAPLVQSPPFRSPEAYRILFWHVPFAWTSFLAFCLLFTGAIAWFVKRKEWGWNLFCTGSDLGLLFGLGVVISGPIWGSAEWGVPWDWADLRLNTFGLLTAVALFIVLSRRSQPDGVDTRDTLSTIGLFGFALVPITAVATTVYQKRHPAVVIAETDETGLDPKMQQVLIMGIISFWILMIGLSILTFLAYKLEKRLQILLYSLDEELVH